MRKSLNILATSFRMAWEELGKNKLRSFLSLFGITIGIFCIIAVLATVSSLQATVQNVMKSVGTNTVYIQNGPGMGVTISPGGNTSAVQNPRIMR
jgi:putative ABC transport system permease protein